MTEKEQLEIDIMNLELLKIQFEVLVLNANTFPISYDR